MLWLARSAGAVVLAAVVLSAGLANAAGAATCGALVAGGTVPAFIDQRLAQGVVLLCDAAFVAAASPVTRGALWSAEHPTPASIAAARQMPRDDAFHPDERLAAGSRAELEDYRGSGYDRGHLTPSGDMPTAESQQQSFSLANMVPQTSELNRGPWERIESAVRRRVEQQGELYVVTGPAFLGRKVNAIGGGVLVPTATWKALYDPVSGGTGVYVCTNTHRPSCQTVAVDRLVRTVGIDPFPAVPAAAKLRLMALPTPERSPYAGTRARRPARERGFFDRLLNP